MPRCLNPLKKHGLFSLFALVEGHFKRLILFDSFHAWFDKLTTNGINERFPSSLKPPVSRVFREGVEKSPWSVCLIGV
jgi:hypothetical protein